MDKQMGNGFKGIFIAFIITLVFMSGITDVKKKPEMESDNTVISNENDKIISSDSEKSDDDKVVEGIEEENNKESENNDEVDSGDEESTEDETGGSDGEESTDDEAEDDETEGSDAEKSEVEKAVEAIKGGNINSDEFKNNILILIENGYTAAQIEGLIEKTDSDNDGLPDHVEKIYGSDKLREDTDGDGLRDGYEVTATLTNPCFKDSDNNGVLDNNEDLDKDGLSNGEELTYGTNPLVNDTDEDGIKDFEEINTYGTEANSEDTDSDGLDDYTEIFVTKTNPLSPDSESIVTVETDISNSFAELSMEVEGQAKHIWDLSVLDLPEASILSWERISGMYGKAYDFSTIGDFDKCTVYIDILDGKSSVDYGFYYFDEEHGTFEEVENQTYENGRLTAELQHFSKYVVLNKEKYDEASYDVKNIIQKAYERDPNEDTDKDGFNDEIDPTPARANYFATYNDYVRYFYGNQGVVSVFADQPLPGTSAIYNMFKKPNVGHTFMSYTLGSEEYYSGLSPISMKPSEVFNRRDRDAKVNSRDGVYALANINGSMVKKLFTYDEISREDNYDGEHPWSVALPIKVDNIGLNAYSNYVKDYSKYYNLYTNNCTTFVLDFLEEYGIKGMLYDGTLSPTVAENYLGFTGGTPGHIGQYIREKYLVESVRETNIKRYDEITVKAYRSILSDRLNIKTDNSLEDNCDTVKEAVTEFNGHYYGIIKIKDKDYRFKTEWDQAKASAEELGGYLAVINSKEEDEFAYNLANDVYGVSSCYFGLSDANTEGVWEWVNGEVFDYQNWEEGEPNNQGEREHYGMYYYRFGGSKWNDGDGDDGVGIYLVEFENMP